MDVREDTAIIHLPGLKEEPKGLVPAGGEVLNCRCSSH